MDAVPSSSSNVRAVGLMGGRGEAVGVGSIKLLVEVEVLRAEV